jgi:hypothetical protein
MNADRNLFEYLHRNSFSVGQLADFTEVKSAELPDVKQGIDRVNAGFCRISKGEESYLRS